MCDRRYVQHTLYIHTEIRSTSLTSGLVGLFSAPIGSALVETRSYVNAMLTRPAAMAARYPNHFPPRLPALLYYCVAIGSRTALISFCYCPFLFKLSEKLDYLFVKIGLSTLRRYLPQKYI